LSAVTRLPIRRRAALADVGALLLWVMVQRWGVASIIVANFNRSSFMLTAYQTWWLGLDPLEPGRLGENRSAGEGALDLWKAAAIAWQHLSAAEGVRGAVLDPRRAGWTGRERPSTRAARG
jgi:hypothetical protein